LVRLDSLRTMSWNVEVDVSSRYTDASKRSLPEHFNLCSFLRELNKPVADRKSGMPADTEMPAPAITTILRFLCKTLSKRRSCSGSSSPILRLVRSSCSAVRSLGSVAFLLFTGRWLSSLPEGGGGMSFIAGEVLPDERGEEVCSWSTNSTCFVCLRILQMAVFKWPCSEIVRLERLPRGYHDSLCFWM